MKYLILGGGIAALSAARAIRAEDKSADIIMLTDEARSPYRRPLLSKAAFSGLDPSRLGLDMEGLGAELHTGCLVERVDAGSRLVETGCGPFEYDACIYALGAHPFVPDFAGSGGGHVLRNVEDFFAIKRRLPASRSAAIVGGGVIGLEAAWLLRKRGLTVRVIETAPYLMPRQLDREAAGLVAALLEERGIAVETGASLEHAPPEELLIISCGIRPNDGPARAGGIELSVDPFMRTGTPGVYACGDCVGAGLWSTAMEQGRAAGTNAVRELLGGDMAPCKAADGRLLLDLGGGGVYAAGRITPDGVTSALASDGLFRVNSSWRGATHSRVFYENAKPVGWIVVGDRAAAARLRREIC